MTELEVQAIDEAYKALLMERFKVFVIDGDSTSAYGHGALERFTKSIAHLREARAAVVKVMVGDGSGDR